MFTPKPVAVPADDFEVEYHLTRNGWVRGSEWFLGTLQAETPAPSDRVLTLKKRLFQSSVTAAREITWFTVWRDPRLGDAEISSLRNRFTLPETS